MKKGIKYALLTATFAVATLGGLFSMSACGKNDPNADSLMLHLAFDEGKGTVVKDSSKKVENATLQYVLSDPKSQPEAQDPQWRENGVAGGCILFDGYSNYIRYNYDDIKVRGTGFTISAYVAPRAFEYDSPDAVSNGTEKLTAIASQMYKSGSSGEGFILGYQRHGAWSFQVGLGDRWLSLWDEGHPLQKYEWNHVVGVFDGVNGEMSIYLNGELVNSMTFFEGAQISPAVDEYLYIGRHSKPDSNATASRNMVSGLLDEVKLYSKAITAQEVKTYYDEYELPEIKFEDIWLQNILTDDYYKTQLHGGPYQHWMNEPHAPMYYNGKYHIFFQFNPFGPYFLVGQICWGHLVSDDMVNWTPMKEVIAPAANSVAPDGIWSGGVTYDKNGIPLLFFTAGNDSYGSSGLISNQNIGIAYPKDPSDPNLTEWVVCDKLAIKQVNGQGRRGEFRDAHIWKEGNTWCLLVGTGSTRTSGGTAILYTATNLLCNFDGTVTMNWEYRGPVYEMTDQPANLGRVWELPVILPIQNDAGTVKKHIFLISPAPADSADNKIYYFLGKFDVNTGKFTPDADFDNNPHLLDYGANVFTGPSGMIDPVSGNAYVFSIMQDQRTPSDVSASGWANCVGFARRVWLTDDGSDVKISVVGALDQYNKETLFCAEKTTVSAVNSALKGVGSDMVRVCVAFKNKTAKSFGVRVKMGNTGKDMTSFTYQSETGIIVGSTLNKAANASLSRVSGALAAPDGEVTMDIIVDRSLVEAFFNQFKAISIRSYSDFASTGIELFSEGGDVEVTSIKVTSLKSIYA